MTAESLGGKVLLTRREAALALSVSVRTIDTLLASNELPSRRIGRRRLIALDTLQRFARRDHPTASRA
jgi:excisionase family DNA binding protein